MDMLSMSNAEIDAALKELGPVGAWAADWIAKKEHALGVAQSQAMSNGRASEEFQASMGFAKAEIERLRAALKAADALAHQYPFSEFHERYWQARGGHEACTVCNP